MNNKKFKVGNFYVYENTTFLVLKTQSSEDEIALRILHVGTSKIDYFCVGSNYWHNSTELKI